MLSKMHLFTACPAQKSTKQSDLIGRIFALCFSAYPISLFAASTKALDVDRAEKWLQDDKQLSDPFGSYKMIFANISIYRFAFIFALSQTFSKPPRVIQDMPTFGIQPDDVTYSTVMLSCLSLSSIEGVQSFLILFRFLQLL